MRTVFFYAPDTLADWECSHILAELHSGRFLKDPGMRYRIRICGSSPAPITTMGGLSLVPEMLISEIRPGKDDLLLLPGAETWLAPEHEPVIANVQKNLADGVTTGAICGATMALANAGILDTRLHTSNDLAVLKMYCPGYHGDALYRDTPAITDGALITASGIAPADFAYNVFKRLDVMSPDTLEAWYALFTTKRPEYYHALIASLGGHEKTAG